MMVKEDGLVEHHPRDSEMLRRAAGAGQPWEQSSASAATAQAGVNELHGTRSGTHPRAGKNEQRQYGTN